MRYEFKTQRDIKKQKVFTCHFMVCNSIKNIQYNQVSSEIGCDGGASQRTSKHCAASIRVNSR